MSTRSADRQRQRKRQRDAERRRTHQDKYAQQATGNQADTNRPEADDDRR